MANSTLPVLLGEWCTAPFIFRLLSLGQRAPCLVMLLVLSFPSSPVAAQQPATATTNAPATPTAPALPEVPKPEPLNLPPIPEKFVHPGLLNSMEELQFIKKKIAAGEEPWKTAYDQMKETKYAALDYKPRPHVKVSMGILGAGGGPGGVYDEDDDVIAAYTQALMWIFTDNEQYARNAVQILNAWTILQSCGGIGWYLQASWAGSIWPEAAELIRATYPKWSADDIAKFSAMLDRTFLPILHNQMGYGNRELSVCNALVAIGVFNNDRAAFTEGINHWVSYVPCWIYLTEDGPTPKKPDYWLTSPSNDDLAKMDAGLFPDVKQSWIYADLDAYMKENKLGNDHGMVKEDLDGLWNHAPPSAYVDGLCAETYRDLGHCDLGFSQMTNVAEIAWHQGIDLYGLEAKRITAFMEFENFLHIGVPIPAQYYRVIPSGISPSTFEIAYNHYHNRMGMDLPKTEALIQLLRPCLKQVPTTPFGWDYLKMVPGIRAGGMGGPANLDTAWEALTHAELNAKGNLPAGSGAAKKTIPSGE